MLEPLPTGPDAPIPPKVKPTLFKNRPAWGSPDSASAKQDDNVSFFSRSNETLSNYGYSEHSIQYKEESGQRKKKQAAKHDGGGLKPSKRPRLSRTDSLESDSDPEDLYSSPQDAEKLPTESEASADGQRAAYQSPKTVDATITQESGTGSRKREQKVIVIDVSDSESTGHDDPPSPLARTATSTPIQSIEFKTHPTKFKALDKLRDDDSEHPQAQTQDPTTKPSTPPPPPPPAHDPVLHILVHSRLPNTVPIIAQRKFSQRMEEVRIAWCQKQGFTPEQTAAVFLTWRGMRVYDFGSCRSLGIKVNEMGDVYIKGQSQPPGPEGSQIEMEAVTVEIMEENRREKERERRAAEASSESEALGFDAGGGGGAPPVGESRKVEQTRIILRAKDYDEYRLQVKATTKFSQIANAFRRQRNIPAQKELLLMFDGEKLDPDDEFQSSEVGQLDFIEVYVK